MLSKCCVRFELPLHRLISITRSFVWRNVFTQLNVHCSTADVIKDTLRMKSRQAEIVGFSSSDVDFIVIIIIIKGIYIAQVRKGHK